MSESDLNVPMQGSFHDIHEPPETSSEGLASRPLDPLSLDIEDSKLVKIINRRIKESREFYRNQFDLYNRRQSNEIYYFGRQTIEKDKAHLMKDYESKFHDNALYEIEATLKPLAMSRLPDLIVTPGNDSDEAKLLAQELSKVVDTQIKERENRRVLGMAFKHRSVYFTGVIKVRWDPQRDDYVFECIHPDMIDVDNTCPTNNADDMEFVAQLIPTTIKETLMRFPNAREDFIQELETMGIKPGEEQAWDDMATKIKIREVWFTWFEKKADDKWERIEGVIWKYENCILKKMKNPNYDYEGTMRYFKTDENGKKQEATFEDMQQMALTGIQTKDITKEKVYYNYFNMPRKPFFFFGYDQWGKQPYDQTTQFEQNMGNQKALDKRGKQIEETLDNRGHHIWSKESGLKASDIQDMDMNDPDQDVVVDGDVNNVHKFIEPERPSAEEFKDMADIRQRMYAVAGSNAVRGEIQSDTATTNQIAREADYTRADDLVEDTINAASEWMGDWAMQFIKLRYTKEHFKQLLGVAGEVVFVRLNRNMVREGMLVKIKASGTDKLKAQNNAMDTAKMGLIDPLQFFRDMGMSDPEGRTKQLMTWMMDKNAYMMQYVDGLQTSEQLADKLIQEGQQALSGNPTPQPMPSLQQQMQPPQPPQPQAGQQPMGGPQGMMPGNTAATPAAPPPGAPMGSPRML